MFKHICGANHFIYFSLKKWVYTIRNRSPTEVKKKAVKILWFMIIFDKIYAKLELIFTAWVDFAEFLEEKPLLFWNCLNSEIQKKIHFVILGKSLLYWPRCCLCFSLLYLYLCWHSYFIYNRKLLRNHKIYLQKTDAFYKIQVVDILKNMKA